MTDLKNWTEVTKGLYRYVIAANACYEIHIWFHDLNDDILNSSRASLFIAGDWQFNGTNFFERECLLTNRSVRECLLKAQKDNEENND